MSGTLAAGFGTLRFPSEEAIAAWQSGVTDARDWDDWQTLGAPSAPRTAVSDLLQELTHANRGVLSVQTDGVLVTLTYQDDGAAFASHVVDLASALRAGARHGAEGTLVFLGSGDAEPDGLAHRLVIGGGASRLERLGAAERHAAYGAPYRAFQQRVRALQAETHPALATLDRWLEEGAPRDANVADLHERVMEALADCPDRTLSKHAQSYPGWVVDERGQRERFLVKQTRKKLADARSNDHRAAALHALSQHAPTQAQPLAIAVLESAREESFAQPMRQTAMSIAARVSHDQAARVWPHLAAPFEQDWPILFTPAVRAMAVLDLDLTEPLRRVITHLTAHAFARQQPWDVEPGPGELLASLVEQRALPLWTELAAYVEDARADRGRHRIVERIVRAGDSSAVERMLGSHDGVLVELARRGLSMRGETSS